MHAELPPSDPHALDGPSIPPPTERSWGTGWVSGTLSVALAILGLGAVFCFHFPSLLTVPQAREYYPVPVIRAALHCVLVAAFLLGMTSVMLRQNKTLGLLGMVLVLVAALLGGSRVQLPGELRDDYFFGLDYALVLLVVYSAIFIPLEKLFGRVEQGVFRKGWSVDLTYFVVSALLVQITTYLTLKPVMTLFAFAVNAQVQAVVKSQPYILQFLEIVLLADLMQYWVHRTFHVVPWLWKFHAVHHSAEKMDWMAGNRLHFLDLLATRSMVYLPTYILGFDELPTYFYIIFVSVHSVFIHANLNWNLGWLRYLVATPQFHHWHHGCEPEAIDINFAVHFPVLDWIFGTFHMPSDRWPQRFGVHSSDVPESYWAQWVYPFRRSKKPPAENPETP